MSLDLEHNATTPPRTINALPKARRYTYDAQATHALRNAYGRERTASQGTHELTRERFALIAGMHRQGHSLGTCGGPNQGDRTPTQPDATRTPQNATETQRYRTRCCSNQLGGRAVAHAQGETETCPHLPAKRTVKTEPQWAISATSGYAPTGSTYAPRSPDVHAMFCLRFPINSCFVATPGRNRELFKVLELTVADRRWRAESQR